MKRSSRGLLLAGASILTVAVLISLWADVAGRVEHPWAPLRDRLPLVIDGWQGEDLPLGQTEVTVEAVGKLNYDDYIYRVYRKMGREVFIYAMYWRQGRISVREMAGHTPDGCWVAGGARHSAPPRTAIFELCYGRTKPGEVRLFTFPGNQQLNVVWWHLWGSDSVERAYAANSVIGLVRVMVAEIRRWLGRHGGMHRDQLMVRIHGAAEVAELVRTPPAEQFLEGIPETQAPVSLIKN